MQIKMKNVMVMVMMMMMTTNSFMLHIVKFAHMLPRAAISTNIYLKADQMQVKWHMYACVMYMQPPAYGLNTN